MKILSFFQIGTKLNHALRKEQYEWGKMVIRRACEEQIKNKYIGYIEVSSKRRNAILLKSSM